MTLGRFISGFGNTNPNLTVLGQQMFVPHGSSGTAVLMVAPRTKDIETSKSDCFLTKVFDKPCFYTRVKEDACFYIKDEEEEENPPFTETVDFADIGFTEIKCVQAHGLNEIIVIGKYKEQPDSEEEEVIATVIYIPSVIGGIGSLQGVYLYEPISTFGIKYVDIDRLDGYDALTTLSKICICMVDKNVIWIDPQLYIESSRTHDFAVYNGEAHADPFCEEDSYGLGDAYFDGEAPHTYPGSVKQYQVDIADAVCTHTPNCSDPDIYCYAGEITASGAYEYVYYKTQLQTTGDYSDIRVPARLGESGSPGGSYCKASGTFSNGLGSISVKRGNSGISTSGDVFTTADSPSYTYSTGFITQRYEWFEGKYNYVTNAVVYAHVPIQPIGALPVSGVKVTIGDSYMSNVAGDDLDVFVYTEINGNNAGSIADAHNSTVIGEVFINANGTSIVDQTDLTPPLVP